MSVSLGRLPCASNWAPLYDYKRKHCFSKEYSISFLPGVLGEATLSANFGGAGGCAGTVVGVVDNSAFEVGLLITVGGGLGEEAGVGVLGARGLI